MKIKVNGKDQSIQKNAVSISDLLKLNKVESIEMVSVQLNGNFIDKKFFDKISLKENDELDFLYFMGGGEK
ncbi:MAG: thiamine biosynthesis protein ThiS [Bacteroidetes bacterium GWF2_41_9]|nr:MAG: thiamine biosynthesis protein ThiS [Bacteroidetes bacterium GWC2_40_22]OFY58228.1 MAG: thiamine biosynthesis protein ThiS [Bacteroidetes bacterium GWF2_41_9]HBH85509.1 thiamine biosynthesis protein ThiS [Bacteroidales bacterium]HCT84635.1 thiamine biosynthesis protein ThiS [Candidatus Margulisiibacteriota bacterium]